MIFDGVEIIDFIDRFSFIDSAGCFHCSFKPIESLSYLPSLCPCLTVLAEKKQEKYATMQIFI
jgi:hypothetical protein